MLLDFCRGGYFGPARDVPCLLKAGLARVDLGSLIGQQVVGHYGQQVLELRLLLHKDSRRFPAGTGQGLLENLGSDDYLRVRPIDIGGGIKADGLFDGGFRDLGLGLGPGRRDGCFFDKSWQAPSTY